MGGTEIVVVAVAVADGTAGPGGVFVAIVVVVIEFITLVVAEDVPTAGTDVLVSGIVEVTSTLVVCDEGLSAVCDEGLSAAGATVTVVTVLVTVGMSFGLIVNSLLSVANLPSTYIFLTARLLFVLYTFLLLTVARQSAL